MSGMDRLAVSMLACGALLGGCTGGPEQTGQRATSFTREIRKTVSLEYLLYLPESYNDTDESWPLVLFLHGAGERGDDVERVKVHGPPKLIAQGKSFPFIVVSPQCEGHRWWTADTDALGALIDEIEEKYRVDPDRIYLTGLSMGGFGTWALAMEQPDRFAAIAPVCGRGAPDSVDRIKHIPAWIFHGAKDKVVPLKHSKEMVAALEKAGSKPKFTVYPNAGHDSWTVTYENEELYEWLLSHRLKR